MSASTCLYKSATFESLSYYVGAVDQSNTSNNEQDYYLSNQPSLIQVQSSMMSLYCRIAMTMNLIRIAT